MTDGDARTQGGSGPRPGLPVDPFRLKRAIWRYKWLLLGAGISGVVIGFLIAKFGMTSTYESTAVLRFEGFQQIAGVQGSTEALGPAASALHRQGVLRRIAEEVEFPGSMTQLRGFIDYRVNLMGRTVEIRVPGATATSASGFASAVSDIFLRYHRERQAERIEIEIAQINKRIDAAARSADGARRRYNEFRESHGIADLSTEQESMVESAAKLRAEAELEVSEVRALEAEVESLQAQLESTPQTTVVTGSSPERAAYNQLSQQLATARATLSENHPQVQSLQQQVNQLRAQLRAGGSTGSGVSTLNTTHQAIDAQLRTAKSELRALRERQRGLSEMADRAQRRIEDFSEIEGEASSLLAEVKVSENLIARLHKTEAHLEDALRSPSSGFVILDPGSVPEYPVRNKMKVVVFGGVPLVLFGLALLFSLYREFEGLRVQTATEVAFWGGGPVVGTTSWPHDPQGLDELVAGLDDYAPDARGTILVLSALSDDTELALELADRMNHDWVIAGRTSEAPPAAPASGPIQTPPPSGPYPITQTNPSTALATRPSSRPIEIVRAEPGRDRVSLEAWEGAFEGQALRRAARLADRVLVLAHSDRTPAPVLNSTRHRLGRNSGIGYVVIGLPEELKSLTDRVGDLPHYWQTDT